MREKFGKDCVCLVRLHPNDVSRYKSLTFTDKVINASDYPDMQELLAVSDYLITDYSAIAVEAAILNKKTYYYLYDYEAYTENNGINVSPFDSMPGCAFRDAGELVKKLESGDYPQVVLDEYRRKYLPENLGTSTKQLAETVNQRLK